MQMKVDAKFKSVDLGMKNMLKLMNTLRDPRALDIGLIDAPPEIVARGAINEFGAPGIPERPWLTTAVDTNSARWLTEWTTDFWVVFKNPNSQLTARDLQARMGRRCADDIRDSLENGAWEKNAKTTVQKKGFNWPLVETGALAAAITYKVYKPQPKRSK